MAVKTSADEREREREAREEREETGGGERERDMVSAKVTGGYADESVTQNGCGFHFPRTLLPPSVGLDHVSGGGPLGENERYVSHNGLGARSHNSCSTQCRAAAASSPRTEECLPRIVLRSACTRG